MRISTLLGRVIFVVWKILREESSVTAETVGVERSTVVAECVCWAGFRTLKGLSVLVLLFGTLCTPWAIVAAFTILDV